MNRSRIKKTHKIINILTFVIYARDGDILNEFDDSVEK